MGAEASSDAKLFSELSKAFDLRGAFYSLYYFIGKSVEPEPKLIKGGQQIKYKLEIDPLQKYCVDALSLQQSNKESAVVKTLNKEIHLIATYNEKITQLRKKLFSPISE